MIKFISLLPLVILAKKKKIDYPNVSSHKRPSEIKEELYCEACNGMVNVTLTKLYGSTKESDIFPVLENVCHYENYPLLEWRFRPPWMSDTCDAIM